MLHQDVAAAGVSDMSRPVCPRCTGWFKPSADDLICIMCGHIVIKDVEPVVPMPAKGLPGKAPFEINPIVARYFESISRMKINGSSWAAIVRLINVAEGAKLRASTIQKHFVRLQHAA